MYTALSTVFKLLIDHVQVDKLCFVNSNGHLVQSASRLARYPKGPGFEPDLFPTDITSHLSLPLALLNEAIPLFFHCPLEWNLLR